MKKRLTVLMVCVMLAVSGCYGNNNPSGTERDKDITSKSETEAVSESTETETTTVPVSETTTASEAKTTEATDIANNEPIFYGETAYPDVLTLRVPNEQENVSYEVRSEGLPEDIADRIVSEIKDLSEVNEPSDNFVMLARDNDGGYRLVDAEKCYNDRYLERKTDEQTLSLFPENVYFGIRLYVGSPKYSKETVIKEGLNRIFTRTENNKKMYEAIDAAKDSDDVLYIYVAISGSGDYKIYVSVSDYFEEFVWLGEASPLNDDPDMLVRAVFEYGDPSIGYNVTNDAPYELSVEAVAAGCCEDSLLFGKHDIASDVRTGDPVFGNAFRITDLYDKDVKEFKLSFRIKEQNGDITRFYICQLNEETNGFERVDTFYDKGTGDIYTYTVPHRTLDPESGQTNVLGIYCLCDGKL